MYRSFRAFVNVQTISIAYFTVIFANRICLLFSFAPNQFIILMADNKFNHFATIINSNRKILTTYSIQLLQKLEYCSNAKGKENKRRSTFYLYVYTYVCVCVMFCCMWRIAI